LVDIISRYSVARAYIPAISPVSAGIATTSDQIFEAFMQRAQIRHVPIVRVMAGDSIDVSPKIRISALFPAPQNLFTYSKSNMPEFDFTVTYGSTTFTYLGAATKKTQAFIASSTASLASPGAMGHIVLILSRAAAPDAMSAAFLAVSHFDEIVFSGSKIKKKAAAGSDSQAVSSPLRRVGKETAAVTNALQNIHLTNLRESGSLHVVSNGSAVVIEQWR